MIRRATLSGASVCVAAFWAFASAALVEPARSDAASPTEPPRVENFANGESISYSVALLRGTAPGVERGTVVVENLSSSRPTRIVRAPVVAERFKVLVELTPGENRLTLAVGDSRIDFFLTRRPDDNPRFVRLIYFVDSTGDETFATPDFWTPPESEGAAAGRKATNDFRAKIGTAALLWQTATAERLNDAGYGRRTFSLELDEAGDPIVWTLRGEKTAAEYAALSETERFGAIYREIEASKLASEFARYFVSVAFARKIGEKEPILTVARTKENGETARNEAVKTPPEAESERTESVLTISTIGATEEVELAGEKELTGRTGLFGEAGKIGEVAERGRPGTTWARVALGGGAVAALDASTLFSWPDSPVDVADAFADARPISEDFAADSGFRRTRWALTASTLGAGLHELGHAFGLDHSPEPTDFMSRGFDRFNRIFTVVEPPDASPTAVETVFGDDSAATWTPSSALPLIRSRWIEK